MVVPIKEMLDTLFSLCYDVGPMENTNKTRQAKPEEVARVYGLEVPMRRCESCGYRFVTAEDEPTCPECVEFEARQ